MPLLNDFKPDLINPLNKEQFEELQRNGSLEEKIKDAQGKNTSNINCVKKEVDEISF